MKYLLIYISLTLAVIISTHAQQNSDVFILSNGESTDFRSVQEKFAEWAKDKDLSKEKGWKWYKRWEEHYLKRTDGSGNIVDPRVFIKEAVKFQDSKKANEKANSYSWVPSGPDNPPPSTDSNLYGQGRINCISFHPTNSNIFWVGIAQGGIWKTSNGGNTWTPLNNGLPILRISDIAVDPSNTNVLYACIGDYEYAGVSLKLDDRKRQTHYGLGLYKSTNGGLNWSPTGLTTLQTEYDNSLIKEIVINPSNTSELLAGGVKGMWRSVDGGSNWTKVHSNIISGIEQVKQDPDVIYAATSYIGTLNEGTAGIIKSMDFGQTWTVLNSGIPATGVAQRVDIAIAPGDSSYIYAVAASMQRGLQGFYSSTNGGKTWTKSTSTINSLGWSAGSTGGQGTYDLVIMVDPLNKNKVYTGGIRLWGSTDGGASWDAVTHHWTPGSVHADLHQLKSNPLTNKVYLCHDGGINVADNLLIGSDAKLIANHYYRLPTKWTNISKGMQITSFYRLSVRRDYGNQIIAGAQDNGTRYTNGNEWNFIFGGDGMECILHPSDTNISWFSYQYGNFFSSIYFSIKRAMPNSGSIAGEWTTPAFFDEENEVLYTGYSDLYQSYDLGSSWSKISSFPQMPGAGRPSYSSALAQSSGNRETIYLAKRINFPYNYPSKMYRTPDGGANWTDITSGLPDSLYFTYLYADKDSSNLAWVSVSGLVNGEKVYKTEDGGNTWENISYNLPNVSTNCIVLDESSDDHKLYVGNDLGVFVTSDDLEEWIPFSNDLPNVIVSELEIHANSSSIYAATFGRGIWKTDLLDSSFSNTVGLSSYINQHIEVNLIPNPNRGVFYLEFKSAEEDLITLEVIDIMGQKVHEEIYNVKTGNNRIDLNLSLKSGQYFIRMKGTEMRLVEKFIVD